MLGEIIKIAENSSARIDNGTLFCDNWKVSNKEIVDYLFQHNCFENSIIPDDVKLGDIINLELSLSKLSTLGFYDTCETFIVKNKYTKRAEPFYIYGNKNPDIFVAKYASIINFIDSIKQIAKHTYSDATNVLNAIVYSDKKSVVICLDYNSNDIDNLIDEKSKKLDLIEKALCGDNIEKQNLFINELIDFIQNHSGELKEILMHIDELYQDCEDAYQFYISSFSSNKLKFEINTKAIEYTSKIQTVINEAQTKLIAIPSAFVLAGISLDFDKYVLPLNAKNIATSLSLFIFAILIQLFLANQKNILKIIESDVNDYKKEFNKTNIELLSEKFKCVSDSLKNQKNRITIITFILWGIPAIICLYLIISTIINHYGK